MATDPERPGLTLGKGMNICYGATCKDWRENRIAPVELVTHIKHVLHTLLINNMFR